ncbi:MAG: hypothetical protein E6Q59_03740 [Nitrosomonas sp.]|nr:MAG: hypothetical protein E6Q59_03740 [Nitrosomonas sp.]
MLHQIQLFITTVLLSLIFIFLGFASIVIPWSQGTREATLLFLEGSKVTLCLFGIAFVVLGSSLLVHQLLGLRPRRYYLRSGSQSTAVENQVINDTLQAYCSERFPGRAVLSNVQIGSKQLSIALTLPPAPKELQKPLLNELEKEIREVLDRIFGYQKTFALTAIFEE